MHVKQLTTSQAFQMIPRKAIVYQDVKALQVSLLKESTGGGKSAATCGYLRSQDSYLHIPQIYCNTFTVYEQYSQHPARRAGVSWTHTYTH